MIDLLMTFIKYVLLHKYNKINKDKLIFLDLHWIKKPNAGIRLWLYNKIRQLNGLP
jgi:hypothetical protein